MASEHITDATDSSFEGDVLQSDLPVLVDFWAAWCAPCRAIAPHLEKLAAEYDGKIKVVKVDAQHNMDTARANKVANLSTFLVFQGGKEVARKIGTGGGAAGLKELVQPYV